MGEDTVHEFTVWGNGERGYWLGVVGVATVGKLRMGFGPERTPIFFVTGWQKGQEPLKRCMVCGVTNAELTDDPQRDWDKTHQEFCSDVCYNTWRRRWQPSRVGQHTPRRPLWPQTLTGGLMIVSGVTEPTTDVKR